MLDRLAGRCIFSSEELQEKVAGGKTESHRELCELWPRLRSYEGKWLTRLLLKKLDPVVIPGESPTHLFNKHLPSNKWMDRSPNPRSIPLPPP